MKITLNPDENIVNNLLLKEKFYDIGLYVIFNNPNIDVFKNKRALNIVLFYNPNIILQITVATTPGKPKTPENPNV